MCGDSVLVDSRGWPEASTANSTTLPKGKPALLGWLEMVLRTAHLAAWARGRKETGTDSQWVSHTMPRLKCRTTQGVVLECLALLSSECKTVETERAALQSCRQVHSLLRQSTECLQHSLCQLQQRACIFCRCRPCCCLLVLLVRCNLWVIPLLVYLRHSSS